MEQARRQSGASRATRTARTAAFLKKHGMLPPLPHDWTQKELTLQQLVDLGLLSAAEAAEEAGVTMPPPAAPAADDAAAAAAPAPDLTAHKLFLYSQFPMPKHTKTEDWRTVGTRSVNTALERPSPPTLFSLSASVERGEIGKVLAKRPPSWDSHELFILDVQLLVYRAAFNFCVKLPLELASVSDERFDEANTLLQKIGVAPLTKEEVLAKAFPSVELTGDALSWYARGVLPELRRQAADVLSLLTLPYDDAFPSAWFSGGLELAPQTGPDLA